MLIADLVSFRRDLFFEGAVQIGWLANSPERAQLAAQNFMFHGPELQAVKSQDFENLSLGERLVDTCSFVQEIVSKIVVEQDDDSKNPFVLAIAGYGTGKSHLGLTLSLLLSEQAESSVYKKITANLKHASTTIGTQIDQQLALRNRPCLVICLDGMQDFNLGAEFNRLLLRKLRASGVDLSPVELLSPRFSAAREFVEKNFSKNSKRFLSETSLTSQDEIINRLAERSEEVFSAVNKVFKDFTGTSIPLEGQESPQALISCICENYCGPTGEFSAFVVVFDEFGRYLEFASQKHSNAGASALQQIYQGIQDNSNRSLFLGLIQYELKAYLNTIAVTDANLGKYISRYDSADKYFLSSNLETLLAHLITKNDSTALDSYLSHESSNLHWKQVFQLMTETLPSVENGYVWNNFSDFFNVIVKGCWPLDPLTVRFLSRQQDIVQNRSAISFIAAEIDSAANVDVSGKNQPFSIRAADLCLGPMFEEILAAERAQHGSIAESFASIREDLKDRLKAEHLKVLASIVVSQKIRALAVRQSKMDELLSVLAGIPVEQIKITINELINNLCVLEWNEELLRYELVVGAVTRSQFHSFLSKKVQEVGTNATSILQIFQQYGQAWGDLSDLEPAFAAPKQISTSEWKFKAYCCSRTNLQYTIKEALKLWKNADAVDIPRGQLLYCLALQSEDVAKLQTDFQTFLQEECAAIEIQNAPIIGVIVHDKDGSIYDAISRLQVLRTSLSPEEIQRYSKFLEEEKNRQSQKLQNELKESIKVRNYVFSQPGLVSTKERLLKTLFSLFEKIYPQTVPFKFDGFGTTKGNAAKDCSLFIRALSLNHITTNWAAAQLPQTKNRFRTLFDDTWLALTEKCELAKVPKQPILRKIFEKYDERLGAQESVCLGDIYHSLIAPPFGFNNASASLIVAMIIGRKSTSLSMRFDGMTIQREAWIRDHAFEDKKQFFSPSTLALTQIRLITGDTKAQWRTHLTEWNQEKDPYKKRKLMLETEELRAEIGMPEEYEAECSLLEAHMEEVLAAIQRVSNKLSNLNDVRQEFELSNDVSKLLRLTSNTSKLLDELETDRKNFWPEQITLQLQNILEFAKSQLLTRYPRWLIEQRCNNISRITDFRSQMDGCIKVLKALGLKEFVQLTEDYYQRVNKDIEVHQRHKALIPDTLEYLNHTSARDNSLHAMLEDELKRGQQLVELLQAYNQELKGDEATKDLVVKVFDEIENIRNVYKRQKERISALTQRELDSLEAISAAQRELTILQQIFSGKQDDCDYLADIHFELSAYSQDLLQITSANMPLTQLEDLTSNLLATRTIEFEEKELIPCWNPEDVYSKFKACGFTALSERSEKWLKANIVGDLDKLTKKQLQKGLGNLEDTPIWFVNNFQFDLETAVANIRLRLENIQNEESEKWYTENVIDESLIPKLSQTELEQQLEKLEKIPPALAPERQTFIRTRQKQLESQLDSITYRSLLERCRKLPAPQLRKLLEDLQAALTP
jgi:hypothetical protein